MKGKLLTLSALILPNCTVFACTLSFSATNINFGAYDPFNTSATTTALNFNASCSPSDTEAARTITISTGNSGSATNRQMQNGSHHLNYNLYTSINDLTVWGDGSSGTSVIVPACTGQDTCSSTQTIYAALPTQQNAYSGSGAGLNYGDTVQVSIGNGSPQALTVSTSVPQTCQFNTSSINLNFGNYDPIATNASTALDASSSITIMCTDGASDVSISLDDGLYAVSDQRRLKGSGENYLNYGIYQPASSMPQASCNYSQLWTSSNNLNLTNAPSVNGDSYTICGRIPAGQNLATEDTYADTIQIQVNY